MGFGKWKQTIHARWKTAQQSLYFVIAHFSFLVAQTLDMIVRRYLTARLYGTRESICSAISNSKSTSDTGEIAQICPEISKFPTISF